VVRVYATKVLRSHGEGMNTSVATINYDNFEKAVGSDLLGNPKVNGGSIIEIDKIKTTLT